MPTKNELRNIAKNIRNNINMNDISEKIINNFLASSYYKNAKIIACYYPIGSEPNLKLLFKNTDKIICLPKISETEKSMTFIEYKNETNLRFNKYNIPEPDGKEICADKIDIIILPALMADKKGYRLGYGGGYYDRYLKNNSTKATKIIFLPNELFIESLPADNFDIPADIIITQTDIIKTQEL